MADKKADFQWAVIGDANPEPVSVVTKGGKRLAYTLGCADPFELDDPDANIELLGHSLIPPPKPADVRRQRELRESRLAAEKLAGIVHGWRRWNP